MQRRQFLRDSAKTAGAVAAWTAASWQRVRGANDRIHLGLIGCGGRGTYVGGFMREAPGAEFIAFADVNLTNAERPRSRWKQTTGAIYQDFRKLLENREVNAVLIATPDHWHAIPTVLACQAGKDVFVEKPLAHNVREGRAMVEAARRTGRTVQIGTQQRSAPHFAEVAQLVQGGAIGEVHYVRVWNFANMFPLGIGREADAPIPDGLDWDMFLGPAPYVPFNPKRLNYRWFSDYAGGYITDFGVHRFDTVHQIMGQDKPLTVSASGGRYGLKDMGDVPDLHQVTWEYPGFVMSYEANLLNAHGLGGRTPGLNYYRAAGEFDRPNGMAFYGTTGAIFADRYTYEVYPEAKPRDPSLKPAARKTVQAQDATREHAVSFVTNLREGRKSNADVTVGHLSTIPAHLGNIALRAGRKLRWDADRETFPGEREASRLLGRQARKPWDLI